MKNPKAFICSTCGASSWQEIDVQVCEAKHVLRDLLAKQTGRAVMRLRLDAEVPEMKISRRNKALRGALLDHRMRTWHRTHKQNRKKNPKEREVAPIDGMK